MGEDVQATISLSPNSLFISLHFYPPPPFSFPSAGARESPVPSLQVPFLNSPLPPPFQTLVSSLCAPFSYLLPGVSFLSPSCSLSLFPLRLGRAAMLSHNLDNAGCSVCVRACACVGLSLIEGTGARTWRPSCLLPTWKTTNRGTKRRRAARAKQNEIHFFLRERSGNRNRNNLIALSVICLDFSRTLELWEVAGGEEKATRVSGVPAGQRKQ